MGVVDKRQCSLDTRKQGTNNVWEHGSTAGSGLGNLTTLETYQGPWEPTMAKRKFTTFLPVLD